LVAGGQPVLALTTVGRRTGQKRSTVVAFLCDRPGYAVYASNLGSKRGSTWSLNLRAHPDTIDLDGRRLMIVARQATGEDAEQLWALYADRLPAVEHFQAIAERETPIFILTPI